jgi:hypothetical protein
MDEKFYSLFTVSLNLSQQIDKAQKIAQCTTRTQKGENDKGEESMVFQKFFLFYY